MKYKANTGGGDFEPVPAGTHVAICYIVADIGKQPGRGMYPTPRQEVHIGFELPNERIEFEKNGKKEHGPRVIGKTYTASMSEKANLRKHLESWRGMAFTDTQAEDFDTRLLLGKSCILTVTHSQKDGKTYANITGIGKLMKGVTVPAAKLAAVYYGPDDVSKYNALPEWLRTKIDGQILDKPKSAALSPSTPDVWDEGPPPEEDRWSDGQGPLEDGSYVDANEVPF